MHLRWKINHGKKIGYPYFKLNLEVKKIEKIYNSLDPLQQEEIKTEIEKRLPDFWKEKFNKVRVKGTT